VNAGTFSNPTGNGGFTNLQEFLFGTVPDSSTSALVTTTPGTGNVILTWLQRTGISGHSLMESTDLGTWSQSGVPASYTRKQATVPTASPQFFRRGMGEEF